MPIETMTIADYEAVVDLWQKSEGVCIRDADSKAGILRYLNRNPGLSFVFWDQGRVAACILSGHDGRRGYIHHLAVDPRYRRKGIGRMLVESCLAALKLQGILKTHLFVVNENSTACRFWESLGFEFRSDLRMFSFTDSDSGNA